MSSPLANKQLRLLIGMIAFIIAAAFVWAVMEYFYGEIIYRNKLGHGWEWARTNPLWRLFLGGLLVYSMGLGLGYLILALLLARDITLSGAGRAGLLAALFLLEILLLAACTYGFQYADPYSLLHIVIWLFPLLFVNLFIRPRRGRRSPAVYADRG